MNIDEFRAIAHCWIDQAIIDSFDDDLGTVGGLPDDLHQDDYAVLSAKCYVLVKDMSDALDRGAMPADTWRTFE